MIITIIVGLVILALLAGGFGGVIKLVLKPILGEKIAEDIGATIVGLIFFGIIGWFIWKLIDIHFLGGPPLF